MMNLEQIPITPTYLRLIAELDGFKAAWTHMTRLQPERLNQLRKVATIESIGSSTRIEGSRLSDREVELLLSRLEQKSFRSRDEQEVAGYAALMETVFSSYEVIPLTENYIKQLHGILLQYAAKDEYHKGAYKMIPNHVEAFDADGKSLGIVFATTSPFDTPFQMNRLVEETRLHLNEHVLHPLLVIGAFVVRFLAIHPFQDGNGRLSRALTTLLLLKSGYNYVPYVSLESIVEQNKEDYYLALQRTQTTLQTDKPDWEPWLNFFLLMLKKQKAILEDRIVIERSLQSLSPLSQSILVFASERGRITTGEIEALTQQPKSTIKKRLSELVQSGYLRLNGQGRGSWYELA
jgi:Fic family protein